MEHRHEKNLTGNNNGFGKPGRNVILDVAVLEHHCNYHVNFQLLQPSFFHANIRLLFTFPNGMLRNDYFLVRNLLTSYRSEFHGVDSKILVS